MTDRPRSPRAPGPQQPPDAKFSPIDPRRLGLPGHPVSEIREVAECLEQAAFLGVNLLSPVTRLDYIPPGYQVAIRAVLFPTEGPWVYASNGTWYKTENGSLALHKPGLRQLAAAAGMSWETHRLDDGRHPHRWIVQAVGRLRNLDGQWRHVVATKDLDLRDGAPLIDDMRAAASKARGGPRDPTGQILKARAAGARMAESKAVNAVIRDALGLRGSYSEEEAARPFVFPMLVWIPSTPEARAMQAAAELGIVRQVYGSGSTPGRVYTPPDTIEAEDAHAPAALPDYGAIPDPVTTREREREPVRTERRAAPSSQTRAPAKARTPSHPDDDPRAASDPGEPPEWTRDGPDWRDV